MNALTLQKEVEQLFVQECAVYEYEEEVATQEDGYCCDYCSGQATYFLKG